MSTWNVGVECVLETRYLYLGFQISSRYSSNKAMDYFSVLSLENYSRLRSQKETLLCLEQLLLCLKPFLSPHVYTPLLLSSCSSPVIQFQMILPLLPDAPNAQYMEFGCLLSLKPASGTECLESIPQHLGHFWATNFITYEVMLRLVIFFPWFYLHLLRWRGVKICILLIVKHFCCISII